MGNSDITTLSFWFAMGVLVVSVIASFVFRSGQEKKIFSSNNPELFPAQKNIFSSLDEALPTVVEEKPQEEAPKVLTEEQQTAKFVERLVDELGGLDKLTTTISEFDKKNKDAFKELLDKTFKEFFDVNGKEKPSENQ